MSFCKRCGHEIAEGAKFCPDCGATIEAGPPPIMDGGQQQYYPGDYANHTPVEPVKEQSSKGMIIGIVLLIVAILTMFSDPPILTMVLSVAVIAGALFCLAKKYRRKGFAIAALIVAVFCLVASVTQAKKFGLFKTPSKEDYASSQKAATKEEPSNEQQSTNSSNTVASKEETQNRNSTPEPTKEAETATQSVQGGVDPELKAFLDSYEDFVDEYVAFMKKYMENPNNVMSMLSQYTEIMSKYEDFADKIDKYDSSKMSTEDAKYYLEVTNRCSQKMLDIY